jgi:hypothetical protein
VLVRNLAFEATRKDIQELAGAFVNPLVFGARVDWAASFEQHALAQARRVSSSTAHQWPASRWQRYRASSRRPQHHCLRPSYLGAALRAPPMRRQSRQLRRLSCQLRRLSCQLRHQLRPGHRRSWRSRLPLWA